MNDINSKVRINPYPGLRPFREEEEHLFFGREKQIDAMVDKLAETHFLAIVGTSGSGKSSLVNCGLRPALHRGLMASVGTDWRMAQFRPGSNPLRAMAEALARNGVLYKKFDAGDFTPAEIIETTLRTSKLGLLDAYQQARLGEGNNLLVVVDQFEELFRYRKLGAAQTQGEYSASEDAIAFVNLLLEVREHANCQIYVVLTMRSDFLGDCAQFFGLPEAINKGQYLVPRLTREERKAAIVGPAGVGEVSIDPVLLTRLVNDVGDNPDQLSILQHALNRTWARMLQDGDGKGPMELRHYEAIGTMAQALNQHAEEAFAELGSERKKKICERMFKALTDGTDPRGIRRPTKVSTLCTIAQATESEVSEIVEVFREPSRSFLMPPAGEPLQVVDISHESLMRVWERLKGWGDEEARSARFYRRLAETAEMHAAGNANLLGGAELLGMIDWRERNQPNQAWAMQYNPAFELAMRFLDESKDARDKQVAAEQVLERRRATLWRMGAVAVVALLIMITGSYAYWSSLVQRKEIEARELAEKEKERARDELRQIARAQQLAVQASATERPDLALLLSVVANEVKPTFGARDTLFKKLQNAPKGFFWLWPYQRSMEGLVIAFSRDGQRLVTGRADGSVMLWDVAAQKPLGEPLWPRGAKKVTGLAFSRNGQWLAAGFRDGSVILWDMTVPKPVGEILLGTESEANVTVAFSSDDQRLMSGKGDGTVMLWNLPSRNPLGERQLVPGAKDAVVAFSPDGRIVGFGGLDGLLILWDVDERKLKGEPKHAGNTRITALVFDSKGDLLVLGDSQGNVTWGEVKQQDLAHVGSPGTHNGEVVSLAFSPDGSRLVSRGRDGTVALWDARNRNIIGKRNTGSGVQGVTFGNNEFVAAVTGDGHGLVLWDASYRSPLATPLIRLVGRPTNIQSIAFSTDGKMLASGNSDNTIILWDVASQKQLGEPLIGHKGAVVSVAFSRDGKMLASGSKDKTIILWDVASQKRLGEPLSGHEESVVSAGFSPDGKMLASISGDGKIFSWDVANPEAPGDHLVSRETTNDGVNGPVNGVAFSPDNWLAAIATRKGVTLWDVNAKKDERLTDGEVSHVAFSRDGRVLAWSEGATVFLWDVANRKALGYPITREGNVSVLAVSRDGGLLAIAISNRVFLWDIAAGAPLGEPLPARVMMFSPDDRLLAIASGGSPTIWDIDEESWYHRACAIANRNLSPTEWRATYKDVSYSKACSSNPIDPGWIDEARKKAIEGPLAEVESMFARLNELEPNFILDPKLEIKTYMEVGNVAKLFSSDYKGLASDPTELQRATSAFNNVQDPQVRELVLQEVQSKEGRNYWNNLCWQAAQRNRDRAREIIFACEYAVRMEPTNGGYRDSRGVARVLTDDFPGAIEDFKAYIDWIKLAAAAAVANGERQDRKAQREGWIAKLQMGENPLTDKELETLRNQ